MRLKWFFAIFIFMLFMPIQSQSIPKVKADWVAFQNELAEISRAKIISRNDIKYVLYDGNVTAQQYKDRVIKYDNLGRIKEITNLDALSRKVSIIVFRYNEKNLPLLETEFLPTGELAGKTTYSYNIQGDLEEITHFNEFEYIISKTIYSTNHLQNLVVEKKMFSPDSTLQTTEYQYSQIDSGKVEKETHYKGSNTLDFTLINNYNSFGIIESEKYYSASGELKYEVKFEYDATGHLILKMRYNTNGSKSKLMFLEYNDRGLCIGRITYNANGEIISYYKYSYE